MIARYALLGLLPVVAVAALSQRRRLAAIIGMGLFSILLAVVYLLLHAPDVALTEATIGVALVAAIYVLAIRRTGRLTVVADEAPRLLSREGDRIVGLEHEILEGFARHLGLDLSIQFVPYRDVADLVSRGEADIGAGGLVPDENVGGLVTKAYLETALFTLGSTPTPAASVPPAVHYEGYFDDLDPEAIYRSTDPVTLDLARFLAVRRSDAPVDSIVRHPKQSGYAFLTSGRRRSLHADLEAYLDGLRDSGRLDRLIRRFLG